MKYSNLDETASFTALKKAAPAYAAFDFASQLTAERVRAAVVPMAQGLRYHWAAKQADEALLDALQALADEQEVIGKYQALLAGDLMNPGEHRKVLHHLLRGEQRGPVTEGGKDLGAFYRGQCERFCAFADAVREGKIVSGAGKKFSTVAQIGIGGSDLGPRAMAIALDNWARKQGVKKLRAEFISNVDPDDAAKVTASVPLDETLFVLVSKSGTTQETLANELFVKAKLEKAGLDPSAHMVAVTSETSPLANNPQYLDSFYIDDFIGGRYSSCSAVGGVVLSLAYGAAAFREFLAGAAEADALALEPDIRGNAALLDALLGVWERDFLGYPATAILPYSQALSRFPAHLQQLDMESNGKRVNRAGKPVAYPTGPIVFGEPGTNGQHSFYQLLHQGTDIIPMQFISFESSQLGDDIVIDGTSSQVKLNANLAAQIVAFAKGKDDSDANKRFPGGRPSSLICGERLTPGRLGALLAHYENKVMFQGFLWNLNSFDQEGVQLGKVLTKKVLAQGSTGDAALDAFARLSGARER
jgi:glucose-6-phosphate isomerase